MAHSKVLCDAVRRDYISQSIAPEVLGPMHGVSVATVVRWRRETRASGDDWDKLRAVRRLTSGVAEEVPRTLVMELMDSLWFAIEQLRAARKSPEGLRISPEEYAPCWLSCRTALTR
jgi:hypothetical protein